jgi:hypothetical protein
MVAPRCSTPCYCCCRSRGWVLVYAVHCQYGVTASSCQQGLVWVPCHAANRRHLVGGRSRLGTDGAHLQHAMAGRWWSAKRALP